MDTLEKCPVADVTSPYLIFVYINKWPSSTPMNLSTWYQDQSDCCVACGNKGTLQHYTQCVPICTYQWEVYMAAQQGPQSDSRGCWAASVTCQGRIYSIQHRALYRFWEGRLEVKAQSSHPRSWILPSANDWQVQADFGGGGCFPEEQLHCCGRISSFGPRVVKGSSLENW